MATMSGEGIFGGGGGGGGQMRIVTKDLESPVI